MKIKNTKNLIARYCSVAGTVLVILVASCDPRPLYYPPAPTPTPTPPPCGNLVCSNFIHVGTDNFVVVFSNNGDGPITLQQSTNINCFRCTPHYYVFLSADDHLDRVPGDPLLQTGLTDPYYAFKFIGTSWPTTIQPHDVLAYNQIVDGIDTTPAYSPSIYPYIIIEVHTTDDTTGMDLGTNNCNTNNLVFVFPRAAV